MDRRSPGRSVSKQYFLALVTNFSTLSAAASLGYSAISLPTLKNPNSPHKLNDSEASWFASIVPIAIPIGCVISGPFADKFGRKMSILIINFVALSGWMTIVLAFYVKECQYSILLLGRFLTGVSSGLSSMPSLVYMAEVSSAELRGVFTMWGGVFFSLGVLVVYVVGFFVQEDWCNGAAIMGCFASVGIFVTLFWMPESPTWLVSKNRITEAKDSVRKIFGSDFEQEIETLLEHKNKTNRRDYTGNSNKLLELAKQPTCYKPFCLMTTFFFFQHFSGTYVIIFYAIEIVQDAGVEIDSYVAIVLIALTRFLASILVSYLSKLYGRRPSSILSGIGMSFCMISLATYLYFEPPPKFSWLPVILLVVYFFTSTLGFLTLPFAMTAEVFPVQVRGMATGLVTCVGALFSFSAVKMYPFIKLAVGSVNLFFVFGGVALLGTVFVVMLLPETKGKTLEEIEEYFEKKTNKVPLKHEF